MDRVKWPILYPPANGHKRDRIDVDAAGMLLYCIPVRDRLVLMLDPAAFEAKNITIQDIEDAEWKYGRKTYLTSSVLDHSPMGYVKVVAIQPD